jgi:hypothetical protein
MEVGEEGLPLTILRPLEKPPVGAVGIGRAVAVVVEALGEAEAPRKLKLLAY